MSCSGCVIEFWEGLEEVSSEIITEDTQKKIDKVGDNITIGLSTSKWPSMAATFLQKKQLSEKWINQKMLQPSKTNFRRPDPVDPNLF